MKDLANAIGWAEIITQCLIFIAVTIAIPFATKLAAKYLNLKIDDKTRAYVESAVSAGIRHGVNAVATEKKLTVTDVISQTVSDPAVRASVVGLASDYLERTVPDGLTRLGITGEQVSELAYTRVDRAINSLSSDVQGAVDSGKSIDLMQSTNMPVSSLSATS